MQMRQICNITKRIHMKTTLLIFTTLLISAVAIAQQTQTIRGTILDAQSSGPVIGATVTIADSDPIIGTTTDLDGYFKLEEVPVGRVNIQVSYLGYESTTIPNVEVNSAKEVVLDIPLTEKIQKVDEVVITAGPDKDKPQNDMVTVSSRTLSMVESVKYSGTRSDPSRMAQNFAGVSGASDDRNDIIIRGNSPSGVLWRLEGIDIPSPNHFGTLGTTGGPVTILNTNNLKNSDFLTGAWMAEYGNATSGVFDLQLRNGNNEKYEFLGQVGFNGFELGAEGPFSKNSKASFMVNYRYSTLGVLSAMGVNFGTGAAIPQYQDVTFKINVPTKKAGKFELFGIGGLSYIEFLDSESEDTDLYSSSNEDSRAGSNMGVVGLSHTYFYNNNTFGKFTLAASGWNSTWERDSLSLENGDPVRTDEIDHTQIKYSARYDLNKKFNARNTLKAGIQYDLFQLNLQQKLLMADLVFFPISDFNGYASLIQSYVQWQHKFSDVVTLNSGIHHQHFLLNNSWIIEPRVNLRYQFHPQHSISFGTGLHSQMQPLQTYFYETRLPDGSTIQSNKQLDFLRSSQFIVGYDYLINKNLRFKAEAYYQYLDNAAVERTPSSFSLLNAGADFGIPNADFLVNNGTGTNYGLELTLEKFFNRGYYFLVTASIFDSQYKGSDGVQRSTAFNSNYVFNVLGGKEFRVKDKHVFSIDSKVAVAGGQRYTPIDLEASRASGREVRLEDQAYSQQYKPYFRWDVKLGYAFEGKRVTQKFYVDLQNVTFQQNIFSQAFDSGTGEIESIYQIGFFPDVQYRILF